MNTQQFIINDIAPLDIKEHVQEAQAIFNELMLSHLPIFSDQTYLGCFPENDVRCFETDKELSSYRYALEGFFVRVDANWLDILEAFAQNHTNIMPVLDHDNKYLGYFELNDIMNIFNETPFLNEPGNILVVEKGSMDYSFSEVAQIVESNNAKIYGIFISKLENDVAQITIKIGDADVSAISQTFRRYSYNIISEHSDDLFITNLKERSEYLEKYLNM